MNGLIAFWSYGLAACLFASLLLWRLRNRIEGTEKLLLLAYFATATPYYYIFFIVSAVGILLHMPRRDQLLAASYKGQGLG